MTLRRAFVCVAALVFSYCAFAVVCWFSVGCTAAQLAAFKANPGGTIGGIAAACSPAGLSTAGAITQVVDEGGSNWFHDFMIGLDGLQDFACVENQLQTPAAPSAPPTAELAELSPACQERRAIALVYLRHERQKRKQQAAAVERPVGARGL